MKYIFSQWFVLSVVACSIAMSLSAVEAVRLDTERHVVDLTKLNWQYHVVGNDDPFQYSDLDTVTQWNPIPVGKSWDKCGFSQLNFKTVWYKLNFEVDSELGDYKIGFFASMIRTQAEVYCNGQLVSEFYFGPTASSGVADVDLTPAIQFGELNELVVKAVDPTEPRFEARRGGILGNVILYKTLPNRLEKDGSIILTGRRPHEVSVLLHLGDVILKKSGSFVFSPHDLARLSVTPSMLRSDELVLVLPREFVPDSERYLTLELDHVNPAKSQFPLALSCDPVGSVAQYERISIPLKLSATYANPFDPSEIKVSANILTPSGDLETVSAFFLQDFRRVPINGLDEEILLPVQGNPWKLYYRAREVGTHQIELVAQDRSGIVHFDAGQFECLPSDQAGYLRVSKKDPRFFEYDNGKSFFATGPSGWFRDDNFIYGGITRWVTTQRAAMYYDEKGKYKSSFEYIPSIFFGKLLIEDGFIDLHVAWKLEQAVSQMEKNHVHWLVMYDDVRRIPFEYSTYSIHQGGPCKTINELYFNEEAIRMQHNQLRYFVSRLSDSPAIWLWNVGDEWRSQPGRRFSETMVASWILEMHRYIKSIDIYRHPHAIGEDFEAFHRESDAAMLGGWYFHSDRGECAPHFRDMIDFCNCLQTDYRDLSMAVINMEGGICEFNNRMYLSGEAYDFPESIGYHKHLWYSLFMKNAAGGTEWLGHVVMRDRQLFHALALQKFIEGESLTEPRWTRSEVEVSDPRLVAMGLVNQDQTWIWSQNKDYTWYRAGYLKETVEPVQKVDVWAPVRQEGNFKVEYWDTREGKILKTEMLPSSGGKVPIHLPSIAKDIALKVVFNR